MGAEAGSPADLLEDGLPLLGVLGDCLILEHGFVTAADVQICVVVGVVSDQELVVFELQVSQCGRALRKS